MKIALVTTTIQTPAVLELLRVYDPEVRFFVAFDENTPEEAVNFTAHNLPNTYPIYIQDQQKWKCSSLIGFKCIQRRNLATLEALDWGADIIVTWDTDNLPTGADYFTDFECLLSSPLHGLEIVANQRWFNHGVFLQPPCRHRGIPRNVDSTDGFIRYAVNRKIGVATGCVLGNPDIDAIERMATSPYVHGVSQLGHDGVFIAPGTWTVFNSQNTAFLRKFAPAMFMLPGVGRMDDILASLICQRVMREENYAVHVGKPFVYQERNQHNLVKDLRAESDWYDKIDSFAIALDAMVLNPMDDIGTVTEQVRQIWKTPAIRTMLPERTIEAALAWLEDCEEVMK